MARAGMAERCSAIAGADGGRVFVHSKASPRLDARNFIYPDALTPDKLRQEGRKLRRTTEQRRLGPSHHHLSDWPRKASTSILRHKHFFDEIGRGSTTSDKHFCAQAIVMSR